MVSWLKYRDSIVSWGAWWFPPLSKMIKFRFGGLTDACLILNLSVRVVFVRMQKRRQNFRPTPSRYLHVHVCGHYMRVWTLHACEPQQFKVRYVSLNLLSPEPVFQVSGSKMTFPEQMTLTSLLKRVKLIIFFLKAMINLWVGCRTVRINIDVFILK